MRGHLLHPALPAARRGQADATHDLGLADVQCCDPLDDLFVVPGVHEHPDLTPSVTTAVRRSCLDRHVTVRGAAGQTSETNPRALRRGNNEGPNTQLPPG